MTADDAAALLNCRATLSLATVFRRLQEKVIDELGDVELRLRAHEVGLLLRRVAGHKVVAAVLVLMIRWSCLRELRGEAQ